MLQMLRNLLQLSKMPFYAVRSGRNPGIYNDWNSCKEQVDKFAKARYKKFSTREEAQDFVNGGDGSLSYNHYSHNETNYSSHRPTYTQQTSSHSTYKPAYNNSNHTKPSTSTQSERSLKQQVDHLASIASDLSEKIQTYERNNDGKKRMHSSNTQGSSGSSHTYTTRSQYGGSGSGGQGPPKRFKHNNSGKFRGSNFTQSEAETVYTDGACFGNGQQGATAGIGVYWGNDHPDNVCERLPGRQTNNRAEIHATIKAIEQAKSKGVSNLIIKTDSQFCINGITTWIHNWKRNGWKLSTGQPVVNKADFEDLESSLNGINVQWVHVRGHKGEPGNEAADRLANQGAVKPKVR